jgi:hypothetical protein
MKVIFSYETQVVIDQNKSGYIWRRPDEIWRPEYLGVRGQKQFSAVFWGVLPMKESEHLLKLMAILIHRSISTFWPHLWPEIARHFPNSNYLFQDDNALVHSSLAARLKTENNIRCLTWPSQYPDINIIEN